MAVLHLLNSASWGPGNVPCPFRSVQKERKHSMKRQIQQTVDNRNDTVENMLAEIHNET